MKGYMYILQCANNLYYVGSTIDLKSRIREHQDGFGANFTRKHLPVKLVYFEVYPTIEEAFAREKQVQGWSRKKKEALIYGDEYDLSLFAKCKNKTSHILYRKKIEQMQTEIQTPQSSDPEFSSPSEVED